MNEIQVTEEKNEQIEIIKKGNRTEIVYKKALLKGKVSSEDVLNTLLMAARMQGEYYISKLSRGSPLDVAEVKALKELAEITKLELKTPEKKETQTTAIDIDTVKNSLYTALTEKLGGDKK